MANTLYDSARKLWAEGNLSWLNNNFYCVLVNASYVFNATHDKLSYITGGANGPRDYGLTQWTGKALTGKGVQTNGAIYADSVRFESCAAGRPAVTAIVIYRMADSQQAEDCDLIYYADTATGLPITPNGGDIIVTWSTGTNRILRL
jgi:hypothetical protein